MRTSWKLPPLGLSPAATSRELLGELKRARAQPWPAMFKRMKLANRRIEE
jgi:hypothetical protein